jgi:hypothetical protein
VTNRLRQGTIFLVRRDMLMYWMYRDKIPRILNLYSRVRRCSSLRLLPHFLLCG